MKTERFKVQLQGWGQVKWHLFRIGSSLNNSKRQCIPHYDNLRQERYKRDT